MGKGKIAGVTLPLLSIIKVITCLIRKAIRMLSKLLLGHIVKNMST